MAFVKHALLFAVFCFVAYVSARSTFVPFADQRTYGWERVQLASDDEEVEILVSIHTPNSDQLLPLLQSVSEPLSPQYGQYLTLDGLSELLAPSEATLSAVRQWLEVKGHAKDIRFTKIQDWAIVKLPVRGVRNLFASPVDLYVWKHPHGGARTVVRALPDTPLVLSEDIDEHVDLILSINDFPPVHLSRKQMKELHLKEVRAASAARRRLLDTENPLTCTLSAHKPDVGTVTPFSTALNVEVDLQEKYCGLRAIGIRVQYLLGNYTAPFNPVVSVEQDLLFTSGGIPPGINVEGLPNYIPGWLQVAAIVEGGNITGFGKYDAPLVLHDMATPAFLRQFYNIPPFAVGWGTESNASQAVYEPESGWSLKEVEVYWQSFNIPGDAATLLSSWDPKDKGGLGGEEQLDIEVITGIAQNITTQYTNIDTGSHNDIIYWLIELNNAAHIPWVHSTSWYTPEAGLTREQAIKADQEMMKLGLRGVTMVDATGDYGASGGGSCNTEFTQYPAASAYITSVGATRPGVSNEPLCQMAWTQQPGNTNQNIPIVCGATSEVTIAVDTGAVYTTAGDFAVHIPQPWYQTAVVQEYLTTLGAEGQLPPAKFFNGSNRGYNDVTFIGENYYTYGDGNIWSWNGGTSASAPAMAGLLSLVNANLIQAGKPKLGFANPLLYQLKLSHPEVFNQISTGSNRCNGWFTTLSSCCEHGFEAYDGPWNPVTGLGSINFSNLLSVLMDPTFPANLKK